jgi:hypothetical protein
MIMLIVVCSLLLLHSQGATYASTVQFGNVGGKNVKQTLPDCDGNSVTFSLTGAGYGELDNSDCSFGEITLYNTTEKSQLTITSKTETSIGDINSNGPLKAITAKTAKLSGSITIGHSSNPKAAVTIVFAYGDGLAINSKMPIKSISAFDWLNIFNSSLTAPSVGSITAKSDKKRDLSGNLGIDVNVAGTIGSVKVVYEIEGSWDCCSVKSITASSAPGFYLTLSQKPDAKILALGTLTIKGNFDGSRIASSGNIGTVTVGEMMDSSCFAGVTATRDVDASDGVYDLPYPADLDETASIKSIKINGFNRPKGQNWVLNSNIAASKIFNAYIACPKYDNRGTPFGICVFDYIKSLKIKDVNGTTNSWPSIGGPIPPPTLPGDMQIRID